MSDMPLDQSFVIVTIAKSRKGKKDVVHANGRGLFDEGKPFPSRSAAQAAVRKMKRQNWWMDNGQVQYVVCQILGDIMSEMNEQKGNAAKDTL